MPQPERKKERRKDVIARQEKFAADSQRRADKHRRETETTLSRLGNSLNPDPQFERGWGAQRAANQRVLDANASDGAEMLARAKKRWWQS